MCVCVPQLIFARPYVIAGVNMDNHKREPLRISVNFDLSLSLNTVNTRSSAEMSFYVLV